ncbi:MAG: RNA methyltransferase [Deltaproteobacteria bacterium]|nr:RNA methyltransferase [Deltaproteobacteria bacterium]
MSRRKKLHADGTPVPRRTAVSRPKVPEEELEKLEALTDTLPEALQQFRALGIIGAERRYRIEEALRHRTRTLLPLLQGIHDPHNQAAVIRSSEALGIQEIHVVDSVKAPFRPSPRVTQSTHRWTEVHVHPEPEVAVERLRARGFSVLATALRDDALPLHEVDFKRPTAVLLGNESTGLSEELVDAADGAVMIPIYGLAQSYNVSVAAALTLAAAVEQRRRAWGSPGDLDEASKALLRLRYYRSAAGRRVPPSLAVRLDELESSLLAAVDTD